MKIVDFNISSSKSDEVCYNYLIEYGNVLFDCDNKIIKFCNLNLFDTVELHNLYTYILNMNNYKKISISKAYLNYINFGIDNFSNTSEHNYLKDLDDYENVVVDDDFLCKKYMIGRSKDSDIYVIINEVISERNNSYIGEIDSKELLKMEKK